MSSGSEIAAAAAVNATLAVEDVAGRSDNSMNRNAVEAASPEIAAAIQVAIDKTPEMQHVLNTEVFWRKRSFWGAFGSGLACTTSVAIAVIQYMSTHTDDDGTFTASLFGIALAAWGGYSSYRAGKANRPLGTSATQLPYPRHSER